MNLVWLFGTVSPCRVLTFLIQQWHGDVIQSRAGQQPQCPVCSLRLCHRHCRSQWGHPYQGEVQTHVPGQFRYKFWRIVLELYIAGCKLSLTSQHETFLKCVRNTRWCVRVWEIADMLESRAECVRLESPGSVVDKILKLFSTGTNRHSPHLHAKGIIFFPNIIL